jgi:mannose-6-phosphate isomerase
VPSPHPQAELWFGAHRDEPSSLPDRIDADGAPVPLTGALEQDPHGAFGPARVHHWQRRLPYLLKVLAAEEPLSLQAHPSAAQAAEGHAREEAAGVPRTAPERNYPDPLPKPEILCALEEFHALSGFRDVAATVRLLRELDVAMLAHHVELLAAQPDAGGLRALFTTWITLPQRAVDVLVPAVLDACVAMAARTPAEAEFGRDVRTLLDLGERYPGDAGVLAALLLNRVVLAPGECLFQPAGSPHAYLSGWGVELMANSDNVLRAGLTPKHVDVPELLRVLDFRAGPPELLTPAVEGPRALFTAPSEHFALARLAFTEQEWGPVDVGLAGPRIAVGVEGEVRLRSERGQERTLGRGGSLWVPACDGTVSAEAVDGPALAFVAADGLTPG